MLYKIYIVQQKIMKTINSLPSKSATSNSEASKYCNIHSQIQNSATSISEH